MILPASFSLSNLTVVPAEVEPGGTVTVTVEVANTGGMAGDYSLVLEVNGEYEESADVTIAAGETVSVSFTLSKEQPGTYTVSVNGITAGYEVAEPALSPEPEPAPAPTKAATTATTPSEPTPAATPTTPAPEPLPPEPESTTNWLVIGVVIAVAVILIIFFTFKFVRRRD